MAESEISESEGHNLLPSSQPLVVGVALDGKRKSKYAVRWALDKFLPEGKVMFKLLHVRPMITAVPTPMGNSIPLSQVREDIAAAYKKDVEWQTSEMLAPFKRMCLQKKVQVDVVVIESNDVATALAKEVTDSAIKKLVIGAASRKMFSRKLNRHGLSSKISACIPNFCTVYAVSKGKLSSIRPSDLESNASIKDNNSETSCSSNSSSTNSSGSQIATGPSNTYSKSPSSSLPMQRFQALSTINQNYLNTKSRSSLDSQHSRYHSLDIDERKDLTGSSIGRSEVGNAATGTSSAHSLLTDSQSWFSDIASTSDVQTGHSSPESQVSINYELEKLRIELRHARGMYATAQSETLDASLKLNTLNERRLEEVIKLKELQLKEEEAQKLARREKEKYEAARREAARVKHYAEEEASQKRDAEMKAQRDMKEKEKFEDALFGRALQYQLFSWEEIVSAASSFSESHRIGKGAHGTVYRCSLHHTNVAVKVLHSKENHKSKQFQQELEILSKIRHPHLLLLIGACPDHDCLIYEYMENGSLEERLLQKNGTPPIPWFARFRIAWEVASALAFLHNSKPKSIVHRDLKPGNILLDHNLVSKIGDVGLSTMLNADPSMSAVFQETSPAGTFCYMDPEYQRTGLVSQESDVYALGVVILQLLTAKPAIGLTDMVERAMEKGTLMDILDEDAGEWPYEETEEFAKLGLSCAELRRRDRPSLKDEVIPTLERLKEFAKARDAGFHVRVAPPNHFICPILKDVMNDPCVAADGYTYERKAIEKWLKENDNSPMINLPLPNKNLIANYTLLSAIMEWKSKKENAP